MRVRFIVMTLALLAYVGCADTVDTSSLSEAPQETQEVAELVEEFLNQAEADLRIAPEHHDDRVRGRAVVVLGPAELHIEVIPRDQHTPLAQALRDGVVVATLAPEYLHDFQGERSSEFGVILREQVATYLLDHERQPVCGERMLGVVAPVGVDGVHTEEALLWLHLRRRGGADEKSAAVSTKKTAKITSVEAGEKEAATYIDCGDDWSIFGTPDCNSGSCLKTCRVKVGEAKVKGVGVIGAAQFAIPFPVYRTVTIWGKIEVAGSCGVDDGWTYNSCACIAECPDN